MQLGPGSGQFNPAGQQALQANIAGQSAMNAMSRDRRGQSFNPQQAEMTMALAEMERDERRSERAADREQFNMQFAASREDAARSIAENASPNSPPVADRWMWWPPEMRSPPATLPVGTPS